MHHPDDDADRAFLWILLIVMWASLLLASCASGPSDLRVPDQSEKFDNLGGVCDDPVEVLVENRGYDPVIVRSNNGTRIGRVPGLQERVFQNCWLYNRPAEFLVEKPYKFGWDQLSESVRVGMGEQFIKGYDAYLRVDVVFRNSHMEVFYNPPPEEEEEGAERH